MNPWLRPERRVVLAGASPVRVCAGAPGIPAERLDLAFRKVLTIPKTAILRYGRLSGTIGLKPQSRQPCGAGGGGAAATTW